MEMGAIGIHSKSSDSAVVTGCLLAPKRQIGALAMRKDSIAYLDQVFPLYPQSASMHSFGVKIAALMT